ncbi:hypothetical protein P3X46_022723 [Hevea brasiliensis]|uniref:FAD dependent oxidoreductase domain-containing protein n=1 Tax=Hevea brasiliensis TaxID=3981 RepID=A0ABQ9LC45_HEVBR|nr:hypothetical protein P3X46_022723 [Hevea brasiliensis]
MLASECSTPVARGRFLALPSRITTSGKLPSAASSSSSSPYFRPLRYAVLGAGFAGLSVVWHLLKHSSEGLNLRIDIFDEVGIGGGASGVSGGLLHPYSPKAKLLWRGAECWKECLMLLSIAERAAFSEESNFELGQPGQCFDSFIVRRRGLLRPATSMKNLNVLLDNAQNCVASCRIETIGKETAQKLVPNICLPFNSAFYMPQAVNVHPLHYLQALFVACKNLVKELSTSSHGLKELYLHKKSVQKLIEFEGEYDAVIICLGAKADMLPELSGRLPLRTCRGVIAHLQLPGNISLQVPVSGFWNCFGIHYKFFKRNKGSSSNAKKLNIQNIYIYIYTYMEEYADHAPSILSDAWFAVQGTRSLLMGSTWEWKSRNSSPNVSADEASRALEELLPKVSAFYPGIKDWTFTGAKAGLRAMPPQTPQGSLPLLGCVNDFVGDNCICKYWLFGGLGSRGLLYHARLGNLMAQAVLSCNEELIPTELTSWKNINQ